MKCYTVVFTIQKRRGLTRNKGPREYDSPIFFSLPKLALKAGLKDNDLNELQKLIVCCSSQPGVINDEGSLRNLEKFIRNSDNPAYVLLRNLLCKIFYPEDDPEDAKTNIDGSEIRIVEVQLIDIFKLPENGNVEIQNIINKLKEYCSKCEQDQTNNAYNEHLCSGTITNPPADPESPFDDLPTDPVPPPPDPTPDRDPREDFENLLNPEIPNQGQDEVVADGDLDNSFTVSQVVDPCEVDDNNQPVVKDKIFGTPIDIDIAKKDQELADLKNKLNLWLNNPDNIEKVNAMEIDFTSISINKCLENSLKVYLSSTVGETPSSFINNGVPVQIVDSASWVAYMNQVEEVAEDVYRNPKETQLFGGSTSFAKGDCSISYNVLPNNTHPATSNREKRWEFEKFPVSFYIKLPNLIQTWEDPKTKKRSPAPAPQVAPPPCEENIPNPLYFHLLNTTNEFGKNNGNTYNPLYQQIIANRACETILDPETTPVYGVVNNTTFFPYGKTDKTEEDGPAIPVFHQLYFPRFITVPINVTIKFIAKRNLTSAECPIKIVCTAIEADIPDFKDKTEQQPNIDCSKVDLKSLSYKDGKPNANFKNDGDKPDFIGDNHFENNSIVLIDKKDKTTHVPFSLREASVVFTINLKYKKSDKGINSILAGNVYINPYHPDDNLRREMPYFTEGFAHYTLILPNGKKDAANKDIHVPLIPNNANISTYETTISDAIKYEMKKINNPQIIIDPNGKNIKDFMPEAIKQSLSAVLSAKIESKTDKCCCCKWVPASNKLSNVNHVLEFNNLDDQAKALKLIIEPSKDC